MTVYAGDDYSIGVTPNGQGRHAHHRRGSHRGPAPEHPRRHHAGDLRRAGRSGRHLWAAPRFAVVMPTAKPERRKFYALADSTEQERTRLVMWVARLHQWATAQPRAVRFAEGVLDRLDAFAETLERTAAEQPEAGKVMLARLTAMGVKVAHARRGRPPRDAGRRAA